MCASNDIVRPKKSYGNGLICVYLIIDEANARVLFAISNSGSKKLIPPGDLVSTAKALYELMAGRIGS